MGYKIAFNTLDMLDHGVVPFRWFPRIKIGEKDVYGFFGKKRFFFGWLYWYMEIYKVVWEDFYWTYIFGSGNFSKTNKLYWDESGERNFPENLKCLPLTEHGYK